MDKIEEENGYKGWNSIYILKFEKNGWTCTKTNQIDHIDKNKWNRWEWARMDVTDEKG